MQEVSQFERFLRGGRSSVVVSLASSSGFAIKAADDEAGIHSLLGHAQASTATRLSLALGTIDPASVAAIDASDLWEDAAALLREALAEGGPDDPRVELIVRRFEAQLNARRQQILGVSHYVWRSRDDGDVRPVHAARDDRVFS